MSQPRSKQRFFFEHKALGAVAETSPGGCYVPGVGVISATATVAAVGDAKEFKNGRQFSAWLGLVPRQSTSSGKIRLFGISKRGDSYLRQLLMHGRALVRHCQRKKEERSR